MKIEETTRLQDIVSAYPWIINEALKISDRFKVLTGPMGKILLRKLTVGDVSKKAGIDASVLIERINEIIENHE